jgi:hypothetical protein
MNNASISVLTFPSHDHLILQTAATPLCFMLCDVASWRVEYRLILLPTTLCYDTFVFITATFITEVYQKIFTQSEKTRVILHKTYYAATSMYGSEIFT